MKKRVFYVTLNFADMTIQKLFLLHSLRVIAISILSLASVCIEARNAGIADTGKSDMTLWGCIIEDDQWGVNPMYGVYAISTSDGSSTPLTTSYDMLANAGGYFADRTFYAVNNSKAWGLIFTRASKFDTDTWAQDNTVSLGSNDMKMVATAMTYDPTENLVYGCYNNIKENGYELGKANYNTFTRETICSIDEPLVAMAATDEGIIYAISADGSLSTMNKKNGELTPVGNIGFTLDSRIQGCCYNPAATGLILAAYRTDGTCALYNISIADASTTLLAPLPNHQHIPILAFPEVPAPGAPGLPENLTADFPKGTKDGNIRFTIPSYSYGGEPLKDKVTYKITVTNLWTRSDIIRSGIAQPGTEVSEQMSVDEGRAELTISLENEAGIGKKISEQFFVGFGSPGRVSGIASTFDKETNIAHISWNKITQPTTNEGYFDPEDIRYDVVRKPDGKLVATGIIENECFDELPFGDWQGYKYEIYAINGTVREGPASSRYIALGNPLNPPYVEDFKQESGFGAMTVVGNPLYPTRGSWMFASYRNGAIMYPGEYDADDWLLTPPLNLKKDFVYIFTFKCAADYVYNSKECIEVGYGVGDDPTDYNIVMEPTDVDWDNFKDFRYSISIKEDGAYRFGFHCLSKANMRGLRIGGVSVEYGVAPEATGYVENLKVIPGANGELSATLTFNLPQRTISGTPVSGITSVEVYRDGALCAKQTGEFAPGEGLSVTDNSVDLAPGKHTYTVTAYNSYGCGQMASMETFIGPDTPGYVQNISFIDNYDGSASVRWNAPTGLNGGYVDDEKTTYTVQITNGEGEILKSLKDYTDNEISFNGIDQTGDQGFVTAVVTAKNQLGEGPATRNYYPLYGEPYSLPFEEKLIDGFETYDCWRSTEVNGKQFGILTVAGSENETMFIYSPAKAGDSSTLISGKITLLSAVNPILTFEYDEVPEAPITIDVMIDKATRGIKTVRTIDYSNSKENQTVWKTCEVNMAEFTDDPYILLCIKATAETTSKSICIRNIKIIDSLSGIEITPESSDVTVATKMGTCIVKGAEGKQIEIYSLSGIRFVSKTARSHEEFPLEKGYCIVRVGSVSYKIAIR